MSTATVLGLLIAGATLVFSFMITTLGFIVNMTRKWTRVEDHLGTVVDNVEKLVKDKDQVHKELSDAMREDRRVTNERLTWLERNLYNRNGA